MQLFRRDKHGRLSTINLEDYLKELEEKKHYIELANQHIELLEKIEEALQVEGILIDLNKEITGSLDNWYN